MNVPVGQSSGEAIARPLLIPARAGVRAWTYHHLQMRIEASIALVTLARPPSNALGHLMLNDLEQAFDILASDEVRVVIVTGAGHTFSLGADIQEVLASTPAEMREVMRKGHQCLDRIERFGKPVIAAINGYCLGGGLEVALACHLRIASARTKLGLPEVTLGLVPGLGGMQRLPLLVGRARAYEMILTGRHVKAQEALEMGLVNAVVSPDELLEVAERLARRITAKSPAAVEAAMRCIRGGAYSGSTKAKARHIERSSFEKLSQSAAVRRTLRMLAGEPSSSRHHQKEETMREEKA